MARLGASVTGIDASEKNITVAKLHSKKSNLRINYLNTSPENLSYSEKFDIILNLEVVEHVNDVNLYIKSCYKLLKKWLNVYSNIKQIFYILHKSNNWC